MLGMREMTWPAGLPRVASWFGFRKPAVPPSPQDAAAAFDRLSATVPQLPPVIFVELAMACNLGCRMCPVPRNTDHMDGRKRSVMAPRTFQRILDAIADAPRTLWLNQLGEPLLNKHLVAFVRSAKAAGHHVGFTTNGTLLDEVKSTALLDAGLDHIVFSVDGATRETFERIRIGAEFEVVEANIRRFSALAAERGGTCRVQVDMIVSDLTEHEISAFMQRWEGVAIPTLIPLDDWAGQLPLDDAFGKARTPKDARARYPCNLLWTSSNISAEGNVIFCCHDYSKRSGLPNVLDRDYAEIWRTEVAAERQRHLDGEYRSPPCADCHAWKTRQPPASWTTPGVPDDEARAPAAKALSA